MSEKSVDDILSQRSEPVSEPAPKEPVAEKEPAQDSQPRDDVGRFAPKQPAQAKAEPSGDKPLEPAAPPVAQQDDRERAGLIAALVDIRSEARQAKQERDEFRRRFEEATKPKPEPVDFFANPDSAFDQRFQTALSPLQTQLAETRTALLEERLYRIAGSEKAPKIEEALSKAMEAGDPSVHALSHALQTQGMSAVKALVDWYDRSTFDPATKEAEIEARVLAKYGITPNQQKSAEPAPVMPSNLAAARNVGTRAGPAWSGPPPLQDIFKRS